MATLYIIGTPIGNLGDITFRAIEALKSVDLVLCEDTRVTRRLFDRYGIQTPMLSYHAHSRISRVDEIIRTLKEGKNLALVSDAGTPGISDPGAELVARVRGELKDEIVAGRLKIESVPGPSALTAALSIAGVLCASGFVFLGFLPHKKGRKTLFAEIAASERPVIFYESPHRLMKTLESLEPVLSTRKMVTVCRELTKIFEEVISGTADEVRRHFESNLEKTRGELVIIVSEIPKQSPR